MLAPGYVAPQSLYVRSYLLYSPVRSILINDVPFILENRVF